MKELALEVQGLTKRYPEFTLENVSFSVPRGSVVGLIGENGAGKTTTLNLILGVLPRDGGKIRLLGTPQEQMEPAARSGLGVVFDGSSVPDSLTPAQLGKVLGDLYPTWEGKTYAGLLKRFELPAGRPVKALSRGMKMKLSMAAALSHGAQLLLLDEATSGLDPVVRDDILDLLLDFVQEESHAVLISSHITSDLEKIADYIVFLHQGKVVFELPKDELIYRYGILRCGAAQFEAMDKADLIAWRRRDYQFEALVADRAACEAKYPHAVADPATLDEIMLLYTKGER